jgi:hypothetical protein
VFEEHVDMKKEDIKQVIEEIERRPIVSYENSVSKDLSPYYASFEGYQSNDVSSKNEGVLSLCHSKSQI